MKLRKPVVRPMVRIVRLFKKLPYRLIVFVARFSIAAVFWKSEQTKGPGCDLFARLPAGKSALD
ncbi:hypothetical protein AWM79_11085 [Pseudomonas agarici]|uniref:Uncharacterized protein n=1 Tax=Pseudomonas agarici TaxID=46677 RepID=A0A0X1T166_PSEAA|nr:hypothetical protein [Pseudomonas agarici]AMB85817.1 hypothetical protein AWM79_11085 [Pseudomonas agarici]NWB89859.1 hypothetical protein [Pseudomonas agarici]NWC07306.1 hypothetical protein [Pseudomonas agarici]SEK48756.1 hypothetical protein SAMN05216604_103245 [Pseudomonas agarici]